MTSKTNKTSGIQAILDSVRHVQQLDGTILYAAIDVIAVLTEEESAFHQWERIKQGEPSLARQIRLAEFPGQPTSSDGLPLEGVLRLIQSIHSPKAERLKTWLAESARDQLLESENPEMLALRARRLYEQKGYSRRWIDKRLRGSSARQEMTGEWYRRGINQGEQFRELTNQFMRHGFGMDVERYRRYKSLAGTSQNLRDHMFDLELALITLGETVAVGLHQARGSNSFEQLAADSIDAGKVVARTRRQVERLSGRPVVQPGNHLAGSRIAARKRRTNGHAHRPTHPGQTADARPELAERGRDMQNPTSSHPARSVA